MNRFTPMFASLSLLPLAVGAAGGHYPVDDASAVGAGSFQVESWPTHTDRDNHEWALMPAWGAGARVDLYLGLLRVREDGHAYNRLEPGAKWLLRAADEGGPSLALAVTAGVDEGRIEDLLVNLPISFGVDDLSLDLHLNTGWLRLRDADRGSLDRVFLGLGAEWTPLRRVGFVGQVYRQGVDAEPEAQFGVRFSPGVAFEVVDLAVGRALRGAERNWFVTLGLATGF